MRKLFGGEKSSLRDGLRKLFIRPNIQACRPDNGILVFAQHDIEFWYRILKQSTHRLPFGSSVGVESRLRESDAR